MVVSHPVPPVNLERIIVSWPVVFLSLFASLAEIFLSLVQNNIKFIQFSKIEVLYRIP